MTHKEQQALMAYRRINHLIVSKLEDDIAEYEEVLKLPDESGIHRHFQYRNKELEEILNIISNDD